VHLLYNMMLQEVNGTHTKKDPSLQEARGSEKQQQQQQQ
jgi:hypothetical protein